jgi:hypothetical protein
MWSVPEPAEGLGRPLTDFWGNQWDFVDFEWINGIIAPRKITCSMDSLMEKSAETCRKRVW